MIMMTIDDCALRLVNVDGISLSDCVHFLKKFYGVSDEVAIVVASRACREVGVCFLETIYFAESGGGK